LASDEVDDYRENRCDQAPTYTPENEGDEDGDEQSRRDDFGCLDSSSKHDRDRDPQHREAQREHQLS
jgi:hypothetical protein